MDSIISNQERKKHDVSQQHSINNKEYKICTNKQAIKKINVSRVHTTYKGKDFTIEKNPPASFQTPENLQKRCLLTENYLGNSSQCDRKHITPEEHDKDSNGQSTNVDKQNNNMKNYKFKDENTHCKTKLEDECDLNSVTYINGLKNIEEYNQIQNETVIFGNNVYETDKKTSYICQAINSDRKPVRINNEVIEDKLILSCQPRTHNEFRRNLKDSIKIERDDARYNYPPKIDKTVETEDTLNEHEKISYHYSTELYHLPPPKNADKSTLIRSNDCDMKVSLVNDVQKTFHHTKSEVKKEHGNFERERVIRCKNLTRKFKGYLWILYFISILLVIIGLTLLIFALIHLIHRNYINIVIEQTGFVLWVWGVVILAVCIIIVGVYGIMTSVSRGKGMLVTYCIIAFILALIILIFLVFLWVLFTNMKYVEHSSMKITFKKYRCNRYIRNAWDELQETHKCCGVENRTDWLYIPPSCCNLVNKQEKKACFNYFIHEELAFNGGCKTKLDVYFMYFFYIIACLLLLAFFLLLLGILLALSLLRMYKAIWRCQQVYYVANRCCL